MLYSIYLFSLSLLGVFFFCTMLWAVQTTSIIIYNHTFLSFLFPFCCLFWQQFKEKAVVQHDSKRMPPERCARLIAVAMANRLDEVWISPNPILLFVYISQYCPILYDW